MSGQSNSDNGGAIFAWETQCAIGAERFRGIGGPTAKSAALFIVSVQPAPPRNAASVLLGADAGARPRKQLAVEP